MPYQIVRIEWDSPNDKNWLNFYNIQLALSAYCKNTKFKVTEFFAPDTAPEREEKEKKL